MRVSDFDYELPPERIAQHPAERREDARLLVHGVADDVTEHRTIRDLPELLRAGDLLVLNDTRVRRARLHLVRASGGAAELLLLAPEAGSATEWRCLARPAARLKPGEELRDASGELVVRALDRIAGPTWRVALPAGDVDALLERYGTLPLPPYIRRERGGTSREDDERYQTVYSAEPGAVAAPTAGLHLSAELLERLSAAGIATTRLTLHVGAGTFKPVEVEDTAEHVMHTEEYSIARATVEALAACRARGGRVVAVGTTSLRALEASAARHGAPTAERATTDLFITPGYAFRVVDVLLTNFHLPRSTLLMLVAAFCGKERVLRLYREAVERAYRFYSYGDAMLLERR